MIELVTVIFEFSRPSIPPPSPPPTLPVIIQLSIMTVDLPTFIPPPLLVALFIPIKEFYNFLYCQIIYRYKT